MTSEELWLRRGVVLGSAVVYWAGVVIQARRVRGRIGRAPNLKPRSSKERLLWVGWAVVIGLWLLLPCLAGQSATSVLWRLPAWALSRAGLVRARIRAPVAQEADDARLEHCVVVHWSTASISARICSLVK